MSGPVLAVGDASQSSVDRCVRGGLAVTECSIDDAATGMLPLRHYDVLLCDFKVAGQVGMDLLRRVRENYPNLAVVMVIAAHELRYGLLAMIEGAAGYIVRSCRAGAFLEGLKAAVTRHRLDRALAQRSALTGGACIPWQNETAS